MLQKIRSAQVIGPLGETLTFESLPPANTVRWVARRKAEVVAAVVGGLLTVDDACERYSLSLWEEFVSWLRGSRPQRHARPKSDSPAVVLGDLPTPLVVLLSRPSMSAWVESGRWLAFGMGGERTLMARVNQ